MPAVVGTWAATFPAQNSCTSASVAPVLGDVVGHEEASLGEVDEIGNRRQGHRQLEPLVDSGVELDVRRR